MKYYSEEETKHLRLALEEQVLRWPRVGRKKMFGCPCYQANGRLFAFLVTKGVVLTQLGQADREVLSRQPNATAFRTGNKIVKKWVRLSIDNPTDLDGVIPLVKKSYESVL